jgi:chromosome segregation ATPase
MIEPIMYGAIGFLIAGLLIIGFIPLVHARAVRLTMRRLEALTPLSMAEIQAEKDQLRAEFAMSTRRLEMSVEQLKAKTVSQLAEIGKKSEAIGRLKLELGEKTAALFALEAKEKQLKEEYQNFSDTLAAKANALDEKERALASTHAELTQVRANLHEATVSTESQRVELLALRAQAEALHGQIESFEIETRELKERLRDKSGEAEWLTQQLADERYRNEQLGTGVADLDRKLIAETTEAEVLARRVEELTARMDEQRRFLADREFIADQMRNEAANAQRIEAEVRAALANAETRQREETEAIRAEKNLLEGQLRQSEEERAKLQSEIAGMKREAENVRASERTENVELRERINDVAAEVARLTATLEGPGSPIETILNNASSQDTAGANGNNGAAVSIASDVRDNKGSLADRIRALQNRASAVSQRSRE